MTSHIRRETYFKDTGNNIFKIFFGTGRDGRRKKYKGNCVKKFFTLLTLHPTR